MPRPVLAIHGSASAGAMWRPLAQELAGQRELISPDLSGYGSRIDVLEHDADQRFANLSRCLNEHASGVDLVAHSFGGALALNLANRLPARVHSLTLYEPIVPPQPNLDLAPEMRALHRVWVEGKREGPSKAMPAFCEFWSGVGSWGQLNERARNRLISQYDSLMLDFEQMFTGQLSVTEPNYRGRLTVLLGKKSPPIVSAMVQRLRRLHTYLDTITLDGMGHLGPVTHADKVAKRIASLLEEETHLATDSSCRARMLMESSGGAIQPNASMPAMRP